MELEVRGKTSGKAHRVRVVGFAAHRRGWLFSNRTALEKGRFEHGLHEIVDSEEGLRRLPRRDRESIERRAFHETPVQLRRQGVRLRRRRIVPQAWVNGPHNKIP